MSSVVSLYNGICIKGHYMSPKNTFLMYLNLNLLWKFFLASKLPPTVKHSRHLHVAFYTVDLLNRLSDSTILTDLVYCQALIWRVGVSFVDKWETLKTMIKENADSYGQKENMFRTKKIYNSSWQKLSKYKEVSKSYINWRLQHLQRKCLNLPNQANLR